MADGLPRAQPLPLPVPPAPVPEGEPVTEVLHGVPVADPYRALEAGEDPRVRSWSRAQTERTRAVLDAIPWRGALLRRLAHLWEAGSVGQPRLAGGRLFFLRRRPGAEQPVLAVRPADGGADESAERPLVDPNALDERGLVALDWWVPSPDGRFVAFGLSRGGDEWSTLRVLDADGGRWLEEALPRARYASVAWEPDGSGFFYTRYPDPAELPPGQPHDHPRCYYHRLGRPAEADPLVFGAELPLEAMLEAELSPSGRFLLMTVRIGWSRSELWLADRGARERRTEGLDFRPLVRERAALFLARFVPEGWGGQQGEGLLVRTDWQAPRYRLLRVAAAEAMGGLPAEEWPVLFPEPEGATLADFAPSRQAVALHLLRDAVSHLALLDPDGRRPREVELPPLSTVDLLDGAPAAPSGVELVAVVESFLRPAAIYAVDAARATARRWLGVPEPVDPGAFEARQVFYPSKDGTRIPLFVLERRGLPHDGQRPTVVTGYGGFGVSRTPQFVPQVIPWLEAGGVWALACLRGGGEYGEAWHRAGMLERKQNVFDDFAAAAEALIRQGITRPERLGAFGRSNGGLLTGAALTQRPDLWRAVVSGVPLLDMVRYHRFLIAALWIPEYGSADDPEAFRWLYAYSPYHHVEEGRTYPAVLLYAAESDTRVDPLHARKMAARLQAATGQAGGERAEPLERPVLLRIEPEAGHGVGKPVRKVLEEEADLWSFLGWQLGLDLGVEQGEAPAAATGSPRPEEGDR
ncbi:MAG: prolyl oligopeptidase family serine peptidase [Bacillota bacterium]|nr:prolyl oligopeptidase family serine peptidase [Bacillota bacterium]